MKISNKELIYLYLNIWNFLGMWEISIRSYFLKLKNNINVSRKYITYNVFCVCVYVHARMVHTRLSFF